MTVKSCEQIKTQNIAGMICEDCPTDCLDGLCNLRETATRNIAKIVAKAGQEARQVRKPDQSGLKNIFRIKRQLGQVA